MDLFPCGRYFSMLRKLIQLQILTASLSIAESTIAGKEKNCCNVTGQSSVWLHQEPDVCGKADHHPISAA